VKTAKAVYGIFSVPVPKIGNHEERQAPQMMERREK